MKFDSLLEQVIAGICIGVVTFLYLMPFIHETGHALFAHAMGWEIVELHVSLPALVTPSYVTVTPPFGANLVFFYMAGSWSCMLWGFLISLLPIFIRNHWLWLSIGYSLIADGLYYPIYSYATGIGDWVQIDPICSVITVCMAMLLILLSVLINKITKWRLF